MSSWHSYPSIFAMGHKAIADLLKGEVIVEEKIDGCLTPESRILKADLTYTYAKNLKVGDELVGFDDTTNNPRLRVARVTATKPIKKQCCRLCFDDGREVTASTDHPWLVRGKANNLKRWKPSEELDYTDELVALPIWKPEDSYVGGYLAAAFDGEGSLVKFGNGRCLSFYQTKNAFLATVKQYLKERGFVFSVDSRKRNPKHKRAYSVILRGGGWTEILRFIGTFRPKRIVTKARKIWLGAPTNSLLSPRLVYKEHVGAKTVIGLSTSTKTYIGEGLLCHNSQMSFGLIETSEGDTTYSGADYDLRVRSKGAVMHPDAPEKMFAKGVAHVKSIQHLLHPGWTYRGEYLAKPKHNALAYDRIPQGHIIIFDINSGEEEYLSYEEKAAEATRLGLEIVPRLFQGTVDRIEAFRAFLNTTSVLGGQNIEGVVVKPLGYNLYGKDKKVLMGKFVSEAYKEVHSLAWKTENPSTKDIIAMLGDAYGTATRWNKSIQHLRERGELEGSPRDIGKLMQEIPEDVKKECEDEIKEKLFGYAWPHVRRMLTRDFPQFYKDYLLKLQFEQTESLEEGDHGEHRDIDRRGLVVGEEQKTRVAHE